MNKFAIVGINGFIASRHIKSIQEIGGGVILTCDISGQADFSDWKQMMQSEKWKEVDYVSLCVPNYLHYEMAKEIAKTKKVLCEKPLALSSQEVLDLPDNVFTVLQLRYHPEIVKLKKELKGIHEIKLIVKVKRDKSYWEGWKGKEEQSGGILFNLGIHYFDLLIYLFGNDDLPTGRIGKHWHLDKQAEGTIIFDNAVCDYYLEIMENDIGQDRYLEIDGKRINLSKQDNLSFEDLHIEVYKDLIKDIGVRPNEAVKSIKLCEMLKNK